MWILKKIYWIFDDIWTEACNRMRFYYKFKNIISNYWSWNVGDVHRDLSFAMLEDFIENGMGWKDWGTEHDFTKEEYNPGEHVMMRNHLNAYIEMYEIYGWVQKRKVLLKNKESIDEIISNERDRKFKELKLKRNFKNMWSINLGRQFDNLWRKGIELDAYIYEKDSEYMARLGKISNWLSE